MLPVRWSHFLMADPTVSTPPTAATSLRQKTVHGMLWVVVQAVATRGVGMAQQLLLAWLLAPDDFGLIALALTVSTFVGLLSNPEYRFEYSLRAGARSG